MALELFLHPLSSYCQKALTAFYENDTPFQARLLDGSEPTAGDFARLWPVGRFPILKAGARLVTEASMIVEYLDLKRPGPIRFVPADGDAALEVRMWDRFFDHYVSDAQARIVWAAIGREPGGEALVAQQRKVLDTSYAVLDAHMQGRAWAAGEAFSLADCAAAPALLYADWTHPIPRRFANVWSYRDRLLARPSYARALDEARPYRHMFPLGAPEGRD